MTDVGVPCNNNHELITNKNTCDEAAQYLVEHFAQFRGWNTWPSSHERFVPGNKFTAGCYWNKGGKHLWFNHIDGIPGKCEPTGPQDCRTLCKKGGTLSIF